MISVSEIKNIIEEKSEGPSLDYKEDITLETDGDKAQFIKDVLSLANGGQTAHIIVGIEDGTRKLIGIKTTHKAEQLNDILKNKCDPHITVEYEEKTILGYKVGVVELSIENPPYIVAVTDQFGGTLSSNPKKSFYIYRGTVFVRNFNKNEGAIRADLDKMYKVKYITLQAELELSHIISVKNKGEENEVAITFCLSNKGEVIATDVYLLVNFTNIRKISKLSDSWSDISHINENRPTISDKMNQPIVRNVKTQCGEVVVTVNPDIKQIEAHVIIGAINMRTKQGPYLIPLKESSS